MQGDPAEGALRNSPAIEAAFEAVPPTLLAQIVRGALHVTPRPARSHTHVASNLGILLGSAFRFGNGGPGGWGILYEPEIRVGPGPDIVVPDLAGWRRTRMPAVPATTLEPAYFDLAPDWICEVLSPGTEVFDRAEKMPVYSREGVAFAWLIDPVAHVLEVFRNDHRVLRPVATHRGDARVRVEPFDDVELDLALVWSR